MSSTSDTSAIDEKKAENEGTTTNTTGGNYGTFFINIVLVLTVILFHFSLSGLVLYGCKVAQSNILPTEEGCIPYTDDPIKLDEIKCNIFNTLFDPVLSMKISFPYNRENSKNLLIDLLRKYKMSSKVGAVPNYFISIIEKLLLLNYSSYNVFLNFLNNAPEVINVIIGPIIVLVFTLCLLFFNIFYTIYLWFSQMSWFFKENTSKGNELPKWNNVSYTSIGSYTTSILLTVLFTLLFFVGFAIIPVLPMVSIAWVLLSIITYGSKMNLNADGSDKSTTSFTVIKELFACYKVTITTIFSIFMVLSAFGNLGATQGLISLGVIIFAYLGILSVDIFNPIEITNLTPLVSYDQAKKQCVSQNTSINKSNKGFLYNLIYGQNGGSLKRDLKRLAKEM
jgi:uncharacterized membrane protein